MWSSGNKVQDQQAGPGGGGDEGRELVGSLAYTLHNQQEGLGGGERRGGREGRNEGSQVPGHK